MKEKLLSKELLDFMANVINFYTIRENIYIYIEHTDIYTKDDLIDLKAIFKKIKKNKYYKEFNEFSGIEDMFNDTMEHFEEYLE